MQLFSEAEDHRPRLLQKSAVHKEPSIRELESFEPNESANDIIDSAPRNTFEELGLAPWLCKTTKAMGFRKPTPVQCACIPAILQHKDVFACAETGSGKTASFVLPMLQILAEDPFGIFGIILTPTRELALQISEQITVLGAAMNVSSALIIGGLNMMEQGLKLSRRPHFVIATPGRLRHHLEGGDPPAISKTRFLVLDEADRLLALGFSAELAIILELINPKRQTLLFSATLTQSLEQLREVMKTGPTCLCLDLAARSGRRLPVSLQQYYVLTPPKLKDCYVALLLAKWLSLSLPALEGDHATTTTTTTSKQQSQGQSGKSKKRKREVEAEQQELKLQQGQKQAMVFVSTVQRAEQLARTLCSLFPPDHEHGHRNGNDISQSKKGKVTAIALHSLMPQSLRLRALSIFRGGGATILVATDTAGRGLDLPSVSLVLSADMPRLAADHVHRAGRAGRGGREGVCISLVTPHDITLLKGVEDYLGNGITIPSLSDQSEQQQQQGGGGGGLYCPKPREALSLLLPLAKASQAASMAMMESGWEEKEAAFRLRKKKQRRTLLRLRAKGGEGPIRSRSAQEAEDTNEESRDNNNNVAEVIDQSMHQQEDNNNTEPVVQASERRVKKKLRKGN